MSFEQQMKFLQENGEGISVLYAEDDPTLGAITETYLSRFFRNIRRCANGQEALDVYQHEQFDIVVTDILMPKMTGLELIEEIRKVNTLQIILITSAYSETEFMTQAIKLGVDGYLLKPINNGQFIEMLYKVVDKIVTMRENYRYRNHLEELVEQKSSSLIKAQNEIVAQYQQTLNGLMHIIESRDSYTAGHSERVAAYGQAIAMEMGLGKAECDMVYRAGTMHDIGKIAIPDTILLKPGTLNPLEYSIIQEHIRIGVDMIRNIPMFDSIVPIIADHHERFDGSGYPRSVKNDDINPLARILMLADTFDAMTTSRIYKPGKDKTEAIQEISSLSGILFDPEIIPYALRVFEKITIPSYVTQLPATMIEKERFAYFYKDPVTGLYNYNYLQTILAPSGFPINCKFIDIISLHKFKEYNDINGWDAGDRLLVKIAETIRELFPSSLIFRLHANDFVLLTLGAKDYPKDAFKNSELILDNDLECTHTRLEIKNNRITYADLEQTLRSNRRKKTGYF